KYVPDDVVIWRREKNMIGAEGIVSSINLLKPQIAKRQPVVHHYLEEEEVMKLSAKSGKSDVFFDGMTSCLNALIFERGLDEGSHNYIDYPLLVLNSFMNVRERSIRVPLGMSE